jgi:cytochrome P450
MAVQPRPACPVHEHFDPLAEDFLADPYAVMAHLPLHETPVFYAPAIDGYVVTRYADVEAVFLDPETYSAAAAQMPLVPLVPEAAEILLAGGHRPQPSMVSLDPPAHTRLRRPTSRAFTPRRVTEMEPRVRAILAELLDAVDPSAPFDLVRALTFPLPATVIFSFMGVPREDYGRLEEWCGHRASLAWGRPAPEEQVEHATSMAAYRRYLRELVASRRATAPTTSRARCSPSTTRIPMR